MAVKDFETLLSEYKYVSAKAVAAHEALSTLELDLADHIVAGANALLGGNNPKTDKPHSWTSAEKEVKEHPEYREKREQMIALRAEAEGCLWKARAKLAAAKHMTACREGLVTE